MTTAAELILSREIDDTTAFLFADRSWSFREAVAEFRRRAVVAENFIDLPGPPHVGVLLDNGPEYLFWLGAAAISGRAVVGINSTYRGEQLAQLVRHTDCQMLVTSREMRPLLEGLDLGLAPECVIDVDSQEYEELLDVAASFSGLSSVSEEDLFLLIFTSGSTGAPKAVRCTQGRFARTGAHVAQVTELTVGDVVYSSLPFFHSSSLFTGWASTLSAGVPIAFRPRFSASQTISDIRRFGATVMTYTGKVLNYILAVPETDDDGDSSLRLAIGNEASGRDIVEFSRRFGCDVRDSYGSTEGIIIIRRDPSMPAGALGRAGETVKVMNPDSCEECPPVAFDENGRVTNWLEAVGEIVDTEPTSGFEGYYKNEEATRARFKDGCYWSGDLAYRDDSGWFYFAGRSNEWLRVDGENFSAAPVEAIISRHPAVRSVAVYAVPDDPVGDRVMATIELEGDADMSAEDFDSFLSSQPDLGPKWVPQFVRFVGELPKLASMKIDKQRLRADAWTKDGVWWRPDRKGPLTPISDPDRDRLDRLLPTFRSLT
ncbi:MAG TPA: AMP-binding protein [Acidimicrobiales bacterium]|nr:AMP-binding protein [Acidimicrobiales bacterium]